MTCWNCGQLGHYSNNCMAPPNEQRMHMNHNVAGPLENECGFCHKKNIHLSFDCPNKWPPKADLPKKGGQYYLQNLSQVPGMVLGLIQEECHIKDVWVESIADCRAAASVVTWEFTYSVYKNEGASNLLSLNGFSGTHVSIHETYLAVKVSTFDTTFNQVFLVNFSRHQQSKLVA